MSFLGFVSAQNRRNEFRFTLQKILVGSVAVKCLGVIALRSSVLKDELMAGVVFLVRRFKRVFIIG